jgi:hypothetical protein
MTRAHEPDSFELNDEQIRELIKLAKFTEKDVFYDRGSGEGRVVIQVAKLTKVKKSIGIEAYRKPYKIARENANNQLTLEQLRRVDFWFGEMKSEPMKDDYDSDYFYDISDATVIYNSLHEELDDLDYYKDMLKKRGARIVTKDLPLVGFRSEANRADRDCWLFMMRMPLKRITSKKEWARSVLGRYDATMEDLYHHFGRQLAERKKYYSKKDIVETILNLKLVVNRRF